MVDILSHSLAEFDSAEDAFIGALKDLSRRGRLTEAVTDLTSVGSAFGQSPRRTVELIGSGFSIANPRARQIGSRTRAVSEVFAIANTIWTLSGSKDADDIVPYNPRGKAFANAGIMEGAVGARIRRASVGDQITLVVKTLRDYPSSRRATIQVFRPEDLVDPPRDTPCTLSLQYFLRAGCLEAVTTMRSQSAAMLLPYDVYVFTMLQEVIASELDVPLGRYHHFCGSLHFYENEKSLVESILKETEGVRHPPMEAMPPRSFEAVDIVVRAEREMRRTLMADGSNLIDVHQFSLPPYWENLLSKLADFWRSILVPPGAA